MEILCFFAGIACIYFKSYYLLAIPLAAHYFRPRGFYVIWFFAAMFFALWHQSMHQEVGMPNESVIKTANIEGWVASIPAKKPGKVQFQFAISQYNGKPAKAFALLNCYNQCPKIHAGDHWSFQVKLKRPRNLGNPGAFDQVRFFQSRHINWTGYLRKDNKKLDSNKAYPLLQLREKLADKLFEQDPNEQTVGITQALTLGVTNHIDKQDWDLFRRTGTIHLMVISGAHIGLVAGITYFLLKWLWSRVGLLCLYMPAQRAASIAALLMAFIYAVLAGFAVPAQRALIVCFFMLLRNFSNKRFSVWQAWRYALLAVLIYEPHSVLMPGFYLSFIAVASLLLVNQRIKAKGFKKTLVMQLACMVGLMPLTLYWFSYGAVNGLVANLVAVPWVGFIIIPMALTLLCLSYVIALPWLLVILKWSIQGLLHFLSWIDSMALFNLNFSFSSLLYPLALMGSLSIFVSLPARSLLPAALLLFVAGMTPRYEKVPMHQSWVDVMDVGQGLAVIIRTANHVLIYDTGVKFYRGSDMAQLALIPYLESLGIRKIDKIIISHTDLDHRGGLLSLEEKYSVGELIVDDPGYYNRGVPCHRYEKWSYDGVEFEFYPLPKFLKGKNNHSCVLQVRTTGSALLLTGDIEKRAEQYLKTTYGERLDSNVLLVPHHSSKTSSSKAFLQQVSPQYALSSYGFDNRYRFPHAKTVQIYEEMKIPVFNTVDCGKIRVRLTPLGIERPSCYRKLDSFLLSKNF